MTAVQANFGVSAKPATAARAQRVVALDALRGLTVLGMIVANTAAGFHTFPTLHHSAWVGYTLADSVFPSFIFMVGVSIAFGLGTARAGDTEARRLAFRAVVWRSLRLLAAGFVVSNLELLRSHEWEYFRICGVLQRIGLVYFACATLYLAGGARLWSLLAAGLLLAYWPVTLLPHPDGPTDLAAAAQNYVSWVDRTLLGDHDWVRGPRGFDPEGVLGVFPAIAQGLIGVLAGSWMRRRGPTAAAAGGLVLAGLVCLVAGLAWSTVFPPVKALWTSSFVLISSGAPLILLGFFWWALDIRRIKLPGLVLLMAFGVNAIFAYVLHEVGSVILEWPIFQQLLDAATPLVGAQAAALAPVGLFVALVWIPLVVMYRRGWIVRI